MRILYTLDADFDANRHIHRRSASRRKIANILRANKPQRASLRVAYYRGDEYIGDQQTPIADFADLIDALSVFGEPELLEYLS